MELRVIFLYLLLSPFPLDKPIIPTHSVKKAAFQKVREKNIPGSLGVMGSPFRIAFNYLADFLKSENEKKSCFVSEDLRFQIVKDSWRLHSKSVKTVHLLLQSASEP